MALGIGDGLPTELCLEARREYRRITSEVATGTYTRKSAITVAEACDEWLAGRRGIRRVTLQGYTH